jgi:uroporphyrinogen-III synthase
MAMPTPTQAPVLAGVGVLITRPRSQSESFAARLAALGAKPVIFPAIEIVGPSDPQASAARLAGISAYDMVIFISPNAVDAVLPSLRARHPSWPGVARVAAVGQGTRRSLRAHGIGQVIAPDSASGAAALLAMPELRAMPPRRVLIVRGEGGREDLARGLVALGAVVDHAEVYRRARPDSDTRELLKIWRAGGIGAVVVTSTEILVNLIDLLGPEGNELLRATPMFTHHPRIAEAARARGIATVIEASSDEDGLVDALTRYIEP